MSSFGKYSRLPVKVVSYSNPCKFANYSFPIPNNVNVNIVLERLLVVCSFTLFRSHIMRMVKLVCAATYPDIPCCPQKWCPLINKRRRKTESEVSNAMSIQYFFITIIFFTFCMVAHEEPSWPKITTEIGNIGNFPVTHTYNIFLYLPSI